MLPSLLPRPPVQADGHAPIRTYAAAPRAVEAPFDQEGQVHGHLILITFLSNIFFKKTKTIEIIAATIVGISNDQFVVGSFHLRILLCFAPPPPGTQSSRRVARPVVRCCAGGCWFVNFPSRTSHRLCCVDCHQPRPPRSANPLLPRAHVTCRADESCTWYRRQWRVHPLQRRTCATKYQKPSSCWCSHSHSDPVSI